MDCVDSYDLCQKCMGGRNGAIHTEELGQNHSFVLETLSKVAISKRVYNASSLEQLVLNMFTLVLTCIHVANYVLIYHLQIL